MWQNEKLKMTPLHVFSTDSIDFRILLKIILIVKQMILSNHQKVLGEMQVKKKTKKH